MIKTTKKRLQKFTIVEVLVAMSVFAILMLMIMQLFGSLQNVWTTTSKRTQTTQNANLIMNMIAADLQSAYYSMDAAEDSSWCYYQKGAKLSSNLKSPVWFVTTRKKAIQSPASSVVETGYYLEKSNKDGVESDYLYTLKNLTISNVKYKDVSQDYYSYNKRTEPFLITIPSDMEDYAVLVDDNIVSLTITPYKWNATANKYEEYTTFPLKEMPRCVKIELEMLDDDPSVREEYKSASDEDKDRLKRKFTRVIEINRGQIYQ